MLLTHNFLIDSLSGDKVFTNPEASQWLLKHEAGHMPSQGYLLLYMLVQCGLANR
jgi:hypothetical protein